ncbi:MAG: cytochrome c oxidase subunit 3 [Microthrixaceae bacterium]|nr:cytochrome c oxidase subunit 3 [Microthrixaceae bacterium]
MPLVPPDTTPAVRPRRRQAVFGASYAAAGAAMLVLTLLALYLEVRSGDRSAWLAQNQISLAQPNVQLFTLVMSAVTMQWAAWAIARDERGQALWASGITLLLGLAFINQTWFLWTNLGLPLTNAAGKWFYAVTGAHVAVAAIALLYLLLMAFRVLGGSFGSRLPEGLSAPAVLWHVVVLLYVPIWIGVYVAK